jgi:DNA-3-methyladenine glycosylase II
MKLRATRKAASVHFAMACATICIGRLSMAVSFHHLYAAGALLLPFFSFGSLLIAVAVAALTPIRGFGLWSAQTFLIHDLARPAGVPAADLGILCAVAGRWRLTAPPKPGAVVVRAAAWRPLIPGGKRSDPKARALLAQASRRTAEQEPR